MFVLRTKSVLASAVVTDSSRNHRCLMLQRLSKETFVTINDRLFFFFFSHLSLSISVYIPKKEKRSNVAVLMIHSTLELAAGTDLQYSSYVQSLTKDSCHYTYVSRLTSRLVALAASSRNAGAKITVGDEDGWIMDACMDRDEMS